MKNISMVFDTISPSDHMFESSSSSIIEQPLSDERDLSQIESAKCKIISKKQQNCTNDMYAITNRYHRLKPSTINTLSSSAENLTLATVPINQSSQQTKEIKIDKESIDSMWPSSDDHHLPLSASKSSVAEFYPDSSMTSYSSSSSISSFDLHSTSTDSPHHDTTETTSSGYESSLNSIPDHIFPSSSNSIQVPSCNLVEQFINLHLQNQSSFDRDINSSPPSSFSSLSSSLCSQEPISTINSPLICRKCTHNNQLSSDTDDDDSQSTTISTNLLPLQQQNKRPRSLPIAIQQPKSVLNDDETDNSSQNSPICQCTKNSSFRICDLNVTNFPDGIFSENNLTTTSTDKFEQSTINQKNSLDHFIMSPTDKVKVQMKYRENDIKNNELKISQPEDDDFKRSKLKAIRVLYQNRLNLNSIQSPVVHQNSSVRSSRTTGHCDSPLAKRTVNPRLFRSALSYSVFEADDEHEVVSSTTRTGVNETREKSHIETFNCLRINFTESLLHGKILPCGILDGFTVKLGASGLFIPKQVVLPVTTFWFNISEHQAASPYLGFINLQCLPKRGYHTPTKGTITLALLNPNGTAIHLFLILYDFNDMPPDHRTFIRQRVVIMPENTGSNKQSTVENLRYLAHIRFVTSQTGKLYMHSDIRLIFARNKLDYDERTGNGKPQLVTLTDMPTPKYWSRK